MSSYPRRSSRSQTSSPPPPLQQQQPLTPANLKQRVITSLNKLADRDTQALAVAELETIAKSLTPETFSTFLNCLHQTEPSAKPTVRRQVVHLLTTLSSSHAESSLSPHLPKILSTLTRRLRDPDSSVRSACVSAASSLSSHLPSSLIFKSLIETLTLEQDFNSQIGAALCLAAAVEAAREPEVEALKKALPKLGKLVRSEGFKPKGAVLGLIGSVVGAGAAAGKASLDWVVPCLVGFLSSEDWMARKAAAEALGRVAEKERELAREYKGSCLGSLESRRFDKVKVVRETMNHSLDLWREVPGFKDEAPPVPSPARSSSIDDSNPIGASPPSAAKSCHDVGFKTPLKKRSIPANRSPPSDSSCVTTAKRQSPPKSNDKSSKPETLPKMDDEIEKKLSTRKTEVAQTREISCADGTETRDSEVPKSRRDEDHENHRPETKRVLCSSVCGEKWHKFGGLRSASKVVPYMDDEICYEKDVELSNPTEEFYDNQEFEDLSLICEQLVQIENQQSNLLDLLQRFIGKSQNGINSLETRVNGLEMALDEISYDLALSSGRIQNADSAGNTCCKLPGTEFLSPKFWRRTEGRYSASRFFSTGNMQPHDVRSAGNKDSNPETYISNCQRFHHKPGCGPFLNPSANVPTGIQAKPGFSSRQISTNVINDDFQVSNASGLGNVSSLTCIAR